MKTFGIFALTAVLIAVLLFAPYLKRFTEGFTDQPNVAQSAAIQKAAAKDIKEQSIDIMQELEKLNKLLENPTIDSSTKDKIIKEKAELQHKLENLTGQPLPSAEIKKEGFTGILSADLEKNSKGAEFLKEATQSSL